jgi:hypothetical protein
MLAISGNGQLNIVLVMIELTFEAPMGTGYSSSAQINHIWVVVVLHSAG